MKFLQMNMKQQHLHILFVLIIPYFKEPIKLGEINYLNIGNYVYITIKHEHTVSGNKYVPVIKTRALV